MLVLDLKTKKNATGKHRLPEYKLVLQVCFPEASVRKACLDVELDENSLQVNIKIQTQNVASIHFCLEAGVQKPLLNFSFYGKSLQIQIEIQIQNKV